MATTLLDLGSSGNGPADSLAGLQTHLATRLGEPFRLARVSYGDELTLHFGELRPARSPKLKKHFYGAYVLGVRGSSWVLKSGTEPLVITAGLPSEEALDGLGKPLEKTELETNPLLQPDSHVLSATPFPVIPRNGYGLQVKFSDGSTFLILPSAAEPDEPEDELLPPLADWELSSPRGLLAVGPELTWSFQARSASAQESTRPREQRSIDLDKT